MLPIKQNSDFFKYKDDGNMQPPLAVEFENKNLKIFSKNSQEFSKALKTLIQFIWSDENAINNLKCSVECNNQAQFVLIKDHAIYAHNIALLSFYDELIRKLLHANLITEVNANQTTDKIASAKHTAYSSNKL